MTKENKNFKSKLKSFRLSLKQGIVFIAIIVCIILLVLVQGAWTLMRNSAEKSSDLLISQVETIINDSKKLVVSQTNELKSNYIASARSIAYLLSNNPDLINDVQELRQIADLHHVDEIYIFNPEGVVVSGTRPEHYNIIYIGMGGQIEYFKPMLRDKGLSMCQDVTPNSADGTNMMYAMTWNEEGTYMIQVGIEPTRLLTAFEEGDISRIVGNVTVSSGFTLYAADIQSRRIVAGSGDYNIGHHIPQIYSDYLDSKQKDNYIEVTNTDHGLCYCDCKIVNDYLIISEYRMSTNIGNYLIALLAIALFLIIASVVILRLFVKLYRSDIDKIKQSVVLSDYTKVMSAAGYGIWHILIRDGHLPRLQSNEKMLEFLGVQDKNFSEEELYKFWYENISEDYLTIIDNGIRVMMEGKTSESTYQWNHPDKGVVFVRCGGTSRKESDGSIVISGYYSEVTESVLAEMKHNEELEEAKRKAEERSEDLARQIDIIKSLSKTFNSLYYIDMSDGSFFELGTDINEVKSAIGSKGDARASFEMMYKYLIVPEYVDVMKEFTNLDTINERLKEREWITQQFYAPRGRWAEGVFIAAERDENGNCNHIVWGTRDIHETKIKEIEYQDALKLATTNAEAASKAKTAFLFNMSHDIRTPMNAIIGYADLLEKYFDDKDKCRDYLSKLKMSSGFLLSLINNVLEMARIESGKAVLDETIHNPSDMMNEVSSVYSELMAKKNINFVHKTDFKTQNIYGDIVKLKEIFLNIVSNAYKYTPEGGTVSFEAVELPCDKPGYACLRTIVSDTGIGMSKEYLPVLFEEFTREHNSTEIKIQGTGLGMPIVKKLVDLMGGTIEVESELGKGSTFIVTIYHKIAEESASTSETQSAVNTENFFGKRILLAEDNELNAEIATEILEECGFQVEHAEDGIICVDMLQKAADGYYDLILMDIQMPNMNGYKATEVIRSMDNTSKNSIPIFAMTANAFDEDKKAAIDAGMSGHLAKPIEIDKLMEALSSVFN